MRISARVLLLSFFFCACAAPPPTEVVSVYASSSAQHWLSALYACAAQNSLALRVDSADPQIRLQLGEEDSLPLPAYQVGEEEIVAAVALASSTQTLTEEEARRVFGQGDSTLRVWVFPAGADVQLAFDSLLLGHGRGASTALVAASARQMAQELTDDPQAIGVLPRRWLNNALRAVYSVGRVPALAILSPQASRSAALLVDCLQP